MDCQSSKGKAVLDALSAAGVPEALGVGIVAVLADAGFEVCVVSHNTGLAPRKTFASVDLLVPSLMERLSVEQSCLNARNRQAGYGYARLAAAQKTGLEVA